MPFKILKIIVNICAVYFDVYIYNSYVFVVGTIANIKWADSDALHSLLTFALATVGIFSAIFLFYTNSFLIKQRKKEFGLYNILGMENAI